MTGVSSIGVSVGGGSVGPSPFDEDMKIAYAGGGDFITRLQRFAQGQGRQRARGAAARHVRSGGRDAGKADHRGRRTGKGRR